MIALGFGSYIFMEELTAIASNDGVAFNTSDFNTVIEAATENAIRDAVCGLVTTTLAPVTTPNTGDLNGNLSCDDCMVSDSLGFLQYPGYCEKFIQIYADSQGQRASTTMKCRAGLFWDNQAMTCRRPHEVQCEYDICLTKPVGYTYSIDHLCSGYITCIGGRSHGACCGVNERWAAGTGCVFDPTCRDACDREDDNRIVFPHVCQSFPIPGDRRNYIEYIEGFGNVTRPCALGTLYNAVDCLCSDLDPQPPAGNLGGCEPSANFTFASDFMDTSKEMVYAGTELVNVQGGNAVFNGNGMVNMYRFANAEFKSNLVIFFRFQASGQGDATQALVSNCIFSTEFTASIVLKVVPIARTLIMTTDTTNGRRELSFVYNDAGINDVTYIYDGECLRGVVNGNIQQVQLTGHILQRRSGIILGAGSKIGHFSGSIKDFLLYKCMPSVVDVYRAQSCN